MSKIKNIFYRTVGIGKNNSHRVWLDGECLELAGLKAGDRYNVEYLIDDSRVVIHPDKNGKRTVVAKKDIQKHTPSVRSLIDLCNQSIAKLFDKGSRGRIITKADHRSHSTIRGGPTDDVVLVT